MQKGGNVYAIRCCDRILCTQKQPETAVLEAASRKCDHMGVQLARHSYLQKMPEDDTIALGK